MPGQALIVMSAVCRKYSPAQLLPAFTQSLNVARSAALVMRYGLASVPPPESGTALAAAACRPIMSPRTDTIRKTLCLVNRFTVVIPTPCPIARPMRGATGY